MSVFLLILGLLLFVSLVVVHEYGHFIMARRGGVEVEEFGIGFPPRIWKKKLSSGLLFTINALPLGGFVRLKGENDSATAKGTFGAASLKTKVKIMLAGVVMNLATALALLTLLALLGMPKLLENQFTVARDTKIVKNDVLIGYIEPDSPAEKAGLKIQDRLISIAPLSSAALLDCFNPACQPYLITAQQSLRPATESLASQSVIINYIRDGQQGQITTTLRTVAEVESSLKTNDPKGYLGVSPTEFSLRRSTWSAPIVAVGVTKQFTELTLKGLGSALAGLFSGNGAKASEQVSGPVGVFVVLKDGSLLGYQFILMIIAIISLTLAIMNVLPIPALDGGRLFVTLVYHGFRKKLTKTAEERIHGTGFALLMVLFILITVVDVKRFF